MPDRAGDDGTEPTCPLRSGDDCRLCVPGATGPENCGLSYLVFTDVELREQLLRRQHDEGSSPRL